MALSRRYVPRVVTSGRTKFLPKREIIALELRKSLLCTLNLSDAKKFRTGLFTDTPFPPKFNLSEIFLPEMYKILPGLCSCSKGRCHSRTGFFLFLYYTTGI